MDDPVSGGVRERIYLIVNPVLAPVAFAAVTFCVIWLLLGGSTHSGVMQRQERLVRNSIRSKSSTFAVQTGRFQGHDGNNVRSNLPKVKPDSARTQKESGILNATCDSWVVRNQRHPSVLAFFVAGYMLNLLPYVAVSRCTFVYHYL